MSVRRLLLRAGVAALALLAADQLCRFLLLDDDRFLGRPIAPFDPPLFSPAQRAALERVESQLASGSEGNQRFDPELGWCNRPDSGFGEFRYDWAGARIGAAPLARPKPPGVRRVLAIGCSMTHGEEAAASESWCALVDQALDEVEVANLGVAAYGLDQALMRLVRDGPALEGDEVWLGCLPAAALRITTLYRPLLDHWSLDVAFKPRFVLGDDGELRRVACPVARLEDFPRLLRDQRALLAALGTDDPWIARAPIAYAPRGSHWMHRSFAARLALSALEAGGRDVGPCFAGSGSECSRLLTAIVRRTAQEARALGAGFRLLVLPGEDDLRDREERGRGRWEPWTEELSREGLSVLDLAPALAGAGPRAELFAAHGHYSRRGNRVLADAAVEALRTEPLDR